MSVFVLYVLLHAKLLTATTPYYEDPHDYVERSNIMTKAMAKVSSALVEAKVRVFCGSCLPSAHD